MALIIMSKDKVIKKIILFHLLILCVLSCSNKKKEKVSKINKKINSKIFDLDKQKNEQIDAENELFSLSKEEYKILLKNNIDPQKVIVGMKMAQNGDESSILELSQLFYSLGDVNKVKKFLEIGVNRNYEDAIYSLALLYEKEGNIKKYKELFSKLSKDYRSKVKVEKIPKISSDAIKKYNEGVELVKNDNKEKAIKYFIEAYEMGMKNIDIRIGYLYKELNEKEKAIEWYEKAQKRGVKEVNYHLSSLLFEMGKTTEARPYLEKLYKGGDKKVAIAIAVSYEREQDIENAVKWYKKAVKHGDKEAEKIIQDIESSKKKKLDNTDSIFGNLSSEYTILESTLALKLNPSKKVEENINENTNNNYKIIGIRGSSAIKKKNYNIGMGEILNKDTYIIK